MTVWRMNGAGNSFAVIDARGLSVDFEELAIDCCKSLNTDGFMALDGSEIADLRLHFYNSDGSRAEMCGNGARCICRFAYDNGIVGERMTVESDAGIVEGERISDSIYKIKLDAPKRIELNKLPNADYLEIGVPHVLLRLDNIEFDNRTNLFERARALREALDANVDFYSVANENTVKLLTYERGVEDFTLACGTGSLATAVVLWKSGEIKGDEVVVKNRGGELKVIIDAKNREIQSLYLEGEASVTQKNRIR